MKRRNYLIVIGIIAFIVVIGGISYSYFVYNKDIGDVTLNAGEISIDLSDVSQEQTLSNVIPKSDSEGMSDTNYLDFTVDGTVDSEQIYYEIYIMPDSNNTINTNYVKLYLTDQEDNVIKSINLYNNLVNSEIEGGKRLYNGVIEVNNDYSKKTYSKDFRLRIWLDENYLETTSKTFNFDINLYAKNVAENYELEREGEISIREAVRTKENDGTCSNITYEEDGITYFSGTNDCIDMNYVWYSGKLWRITGIYPDGAIKLITQNNITSIAYHDVSQAHFYVDANTKSFAYQWLNEDFYDTLYNANQIIDMSKKWNASKTPDSNVSSKLETTEIVTANVGLLNSYEYYNSYRCIGSGICNGTDPSNGYLNNDYYWWLLNPTDSASFVWAVQLNGDASYIAIAYPTGIRPSIVIKPGQEFVGNGTSSSPYKIVGDKEVGKTNDYINTRLSGEYVLLKNGNNEQLFRIIDIEDNKTKIIARDYADNGNKHMFATNPTDTLWGSGTTTDSNTGYTYLNDSTTGYLAVLKNTYGELFDSGLYYLGKSGYNYKLSVCASATNNTIKTCTKTSYKGTFDIGLPRYGELFSTQRKNGNSTLFNSWLMNRYSAVSQWLLNTTGFAMVNTNGTTITEAALLPTLHLKSTVKILSGSGTENDPYVVGL